VASAVALMVLDARFQQMQPLRALLATVVLPLQYAVDLPGRSWDSASAALRSRQSLTDENERLWRQQLEMKVQLQQLQTLEQENMRLRELLGSSFKAGDRVLVAEILRAELGADRRQILINRGARDGVYPGQPLLDAEGIAGQVISVAERTASVLLITDPEHATPVQVLRNGLRTLAVGSEQPNLLELPYVAANADLEVGDILISSGLSGRFPYGYPVARVSHIQKSHIQSFAHVQAEPLARLERIREGLLVWSKDSERREQAGAETP
jgi:rod shape-determining protein MreC